MNIGKHITFSLLILLGLLSACGEEKKDNTPEGLINKEEFTEILLEMQLIEAHLNEVRIDQSIIRDSANHFFKEVFKKHNTTSTDFSKTIAYYSTQPEELQGIYDNVLDTLSKMEVDLIHVKMDEEAMSPMGKTQIIDFIIKLPLANIYIDSTYSSDQTKDSLFRYISNNPQLFDSLPINLESFQKSYIGYTFNNVRYLSFREEIKYFLDSTRTN